jgi:hypothetical protein
MARNNHSMRPEGETNLRDIKVLKIKKNMAAAGSARLTETLVLVIIKPSFPTQFKKFKPLV